MNKNSADVIIIGAGMAGMSCAIWCGSLNLNCMVIEENDHVGGQLDLIGFNVTDYPGWEGDVRHLASKLKKQAEDKGGGYSLPGNCADD